MISRLRSAALAAILTVGFAASASATSFCDIPSTSDGFVALRSGPSRSATIAARMQAGDEVMIMGDTPEGTSWFRVRWWKGQERHEKGFEKHSGTGWVHRSLLKDCG
jgi:uncharacterized protein YraI